MLTIDDLLDDVLLEIFDFYVLRYQNLDFDEAMFSTPYTKRNTESWQSLVHVCRRWRCLVFGSPRRLNLQLFCLPRMFERKSLDLWPALPLLIKGDSPGYGASLDNLITGLEHRHRIRQIDLNFLTIYTTSKIEKLWTAMQVPFPELTRLYLTFGYPPDEPLLPDSLLGGSAPRLQYLSLERIPFPGLPKLLLSATHLVELYLCDIPHSGYISPEAMVSCLSTSLERLHLDFDYQYSRQSYPDLKRRRPFPPTRSVLPALTKLSIKGVNEYLEEFVARIDSPALYRFSTTFLNDIDFNTSEINQFITRTPTLGPYEWAHLIFSGDRVQVRLLPPCPEPSDHRMVEVLLPRPGQPQSALAQICTLPLPLLLTLESLFIDGILTSPFRVFGEDDIENTKWLDFLLLFAAVKNLYLSELFSHRIAPVLQELSGERATEVLPSLQNVLLEGFEPSKPVQEGIAQFISARQLTNHPVAISVWDRVNWRYW